MSIETVREQIFKILFNCVTIGETDEGKPYADIKRQGDCEMIDQILAIPGLRVEAEDQSLPALSDKEILEASQVNMFLPNGELDPDCGYLKGRQQVAKAQCFSLRKAGWVKVEPK